MSKTVHYVIIVIATVATSQLIPLVTSELSGNNHRCNATQIARLVTCMLNNTKFQEHINQKLEAKIATSIDSKIRDIEMALGKLKAELQAAKVGRKHLNEQLSIKQKQLDQLLSRQNSIQCE